jgi:RNA polymerase sigma factor (sigma-70 family)
VQKKRLQRVIREELTEHQRQTLIAYYFQEQSVPEIARNRGVNKTTVWRTLRRAEERLKRYLRY